MSTAGGEIYVYFYPKIETVNHPDVLYSSTGWRQVAPHKDPLRLCDLTLASVAGLVATATTNHKNKVRTCDMNICIDGTYCIYFCFTDNTYSGNIP